MRIGTITYWWTQDNYGQVLQCFALIKFLRSMGHEAFLIKNLQSVSKRSLGHMVKVGLKCIFNPDYRRSILKWKRLGKISAAEAKAHPRGFDDFRRKYMPSTEREYTQHHLLENPPQADAYVCGSDQIWCAPNPVYFLQFGPQSSKRIAYAPSMGGIKPQGKARQAMIAYLRRFDFLSSREQSGVDALHEMGFLEATLQPDPTLLLPVEVYRDMEVKPQPAERPYLLLYLLGNETDVEVDVSSKSNNLLGPGLTLSVTNRNMFRRAENFSVRLTGSYEWQIGGRKQASGNSGLMNSYELGINFNLSVPRLLVPRFLQAKRDRSEQTNFQVGTDLMNRHSYFRMISFWGNATYDFNSSTRNYHSIVPFKLNYTYLLKTSVAFDSVTMRNPTVAQSFSNQFIPSMSYTYTYDRAATYRNPNRLYWQTSITQAGNIIAGLQKLFGNDKKEGKLFLNNRYSQFLKLTTEFITYKSVDNNNQLAFRLMGGIGYAYGNSTVMPYSEQFYIGGANSIRAFQVRNIGPGSYHPEETQYSYLDQTGDIKIEANLEYRFTIYENFKGAFFLDAGNVWLLRSEEQRPGGQFSLKGLLDELAFGTGLGLRYDFSFIVVRADLGVPLHAPYDTGKSGYYNIPDKFLKGLVLNIAIGYPF